MPSSPPYPYSNFFGGLLSNDPINPRWVYMSSLACAAAADGRLFSDLSAVSNWRFSSDGPASPTNSTIVYDEPLQRWMTFGTDGGGNVLCFYTTNGSKWLQASVVGTINSVTGSAASGQGVTLIGGGLAGAGTGKIRETANGGLSWTTRNIGASSTAPVKCIAYSSFHALWFASIAGAGIYSSSDRATWTLRHATACAQFIVDADNGVILATTLDASSNYARSTDGFVWSQIAAPFTGTPNTQLCQGCWSPYLSSFFVGGAQDNRMYKSPTGLAATWTDVEATPTWTTISADAGIAALGRVLVRGDGRASIDGGATWAPVVENAVLDGYPYAPAAGVGMVITRKAGNEHFTSYQIGL